MYPVHFYEQIMHFENLSISIHLVATPQRCAIILEMKKEGRYGIVIAGSKIIFRNTLCSANGVTQERKFSVPVVSCPRLLCNYHQLDGHGCIMCKYSVDKLKREEQSMAFMGNYMELRHVNAR